MDKSGITEETAGQISKLTVSADSYGHPGCSWHTWGNPRPQGGPPQPLEKKMQRRTSGGQELNYALRAKLHGINSPLHGLDPSCVEHGG